VETVEVLKSGNASAYGMRGAGGVLVITTKKGGELQPETEVSDGLYGAFMGFSKGRELYMPSYGVKDADDNTPDLRSTVCWKPEVTVDKDGKASVSFYNSDLKGMYRVVVEGIDVSGNLSRQVCHYRVE
jgi:TonB-dependent SusC/RagA subfamily outer membrane receptor